MQKIEAHNGETVNKLNMFSACCICAWFTIPLLANYPILFYIFAAVWFCTAKGFFRYLADNAGKYLLLCAYLAVSLVYLISAPADAIFAGGFKATMLSLFCVLLYDFYYSKNCFLQLKTICIVSLVLYLGGSALSIIFFSKDIDMIKQAVAIGGQGSMAGNFGTFYGAVFVLAGSLYLLLFAKGRIRFLGTAGIIISSWLLLYGQFALSIMLAVLLCFLILINILFKPKLYIWIIIFVLSSAVFIMLTNEISEILLKISTLVPQGYISDRIADMASFLINNESVHSSMRIQFYTGDIYNFFHYPATGSLALRASGIETDLLAGGHSSVFGLFANYGFFVSSCFILFFALIYKKIISLWQNNAYKLFLIPVIFIFILLSFLNPTLNVQTLCFVIMIIIPSLPLLTADANALNYETISKAD